MHQPESSHAIKYPQAAQVVRFWHNAGPNQWFAKDDAFDAEFCRQFLDLHFSAARREKDDWLEDPLASLALMILLDQFPRNAFRGSAHMFATDGLALRHAKKIIELGHIEKIEQELRLFLCVPFIHSELLESQEFALGLYEKYAPQGMTFAQEHHEIIERFGRFPHRNAVLGRETTPAEQAFLDGGGFSG